MRVRVATTHGLFDVDLDDSARATDLKSKLWDVYKDECDAMPKPAEQTLVFNSQLIESLKSLRKHGVKDGDQLVMLRKRSEPAACAAPAREFPSADDVRRHIEAESARLGHEVTEAPPLNASGEHSHARMAAQLADVMEALQSLDGTVPAGDAQERLERLLRSAAFFSAEGGERGAGAAAAAVPVLAEEVLVAEPSARDLQVLGDMGFSQRAARRALLLNRNAVNNAANYLLAHGGDGDIEAEPSEEELRAVYRAQRVRLAQPRPPVEPDRDSLDMLIAMGFPEAAARQALVRHDNDMESAVTMLTSPGATWDDGPQAPGGEQSQEEAEREADAGGAGSLAASASNAPLPALTGGSAGSMPRPAAAVAPLGGNEAADSGDAAALPSAALPSARDEAAGAPAAPDGTQPGPGPAGAGATAPSARGGAAVAGIGLPPAHELAGAGGASEAMQVLGNIGRLALLDPLLADMVTGGSGPGAWDRGLPRAGSSHLNGAMPILSTGGAGDVGMMDQFDLDGDMRWQGDGVAMMAGFPGDFRDLSGPLSTEYDDEDEEDEEEEDEEEDGDEDEDGDGDEDEEDEDEDDDEGGGGSVQPGWFDDSGASGDAPQSAMSSAR